jgi:hypothetical protein
MCLNKWNSVSSSYDFTSRTAITTFYTKRSLMKMLVDMTKKSVYFGLICFTPCINVRVEYRIKWKSVFMAKKQFQPVYLGVLIFCLVSSSCRSLRSIGPPFRGSWSGGVHTLVSDQSTDCTSSTHPDMTARTL